MNNKVIFFDELKSNRAEMVWELKCLWKAKRVWDYDKSRNQVRNLFRKLESSYRGVLYCGDHDVLHALMYFQHSPIDEVRIICYKLLYGMSQEEALEWDKR